MFFPHLDIFKDACVRCRLTFHHDRRSFYLNETGRVGPGCLFPPDLLQEDGCLCACNHAVSINNGDDKSHEIGIYAHGGGWVAVWDGKGGGGGLINHISAKGQHLQTVYLVEGIRYVCIGHGLSCQEVVALQQLQLNFYGPICIERKYEQALLVQATIDNLSLKVIFQTSPLEELKPMMDCITKHLKELVMPCCSLPGYLRRLEPQPTTPAAICLDVNEVK